MTINDKLPVTVPFRNDLLMVALEILGMNYIWTDHLPSLILQKCRKLVNRDA